MTRFEAAVIGTGPAGLATALALARSGVETALVGPPYDSAKAAGDRRTTALIGPSVRFMQNLGVGLDPAGPTPVAPILAVRMADDRGGLIRAPEMLFRASEAGLESFGVNIPNPALLAALNAAAGQAPLLTRVETAAVVDLAQGPGAGPAVGPRQPAGVRLTLAEGGAVEAVLAVAADGRGSQAPAAAGIAVDTWDYPQAAVAASFGHSRPHDATVNELHRQMGPLTTVPLPGRRSALVWVEEPGEARRLAGLADAAFAAELDERLQGALGAIGDVGPRAVYALSGRRAERMGAARIALVGEAAHVVPPIGAQGLNLGLRDAAALADGAAEAKALGQDIGGEAALAAYTRARAADVLARSVSIDLLNRSLLMEILPLDMLRGAAAHALASFPALRRLLMQRGMGLADPLPSLMR